MLAYNSTIYIKLAFSELGHKCVTERAKPWKGCEFGFGFECEYTGNIRDTIKNERN